MIQSDILIDGRCYVEDVGKGDVISYDHEQVCVLIDGEYRPRWFDFAIVTMIENEE